jgi:glycine betaine/proline transport system ATP-binding protein
LIDRPDSEHFLKNAYIEEAGTANATDSLQDILPEVASHPWALPILDDHGHYLGAISKNLFLRTLHRGHQEEQAAVAASNDGVY